jgi:predicted PurR-regulated permease PerM
MNGRADDAPRGRAAGDHEHVDRFSTLSTLVILGAVALVVYEAQWILLPFVIAGLLAYICAPLIEILARHSRLPRLFCAVFVFLILLAAGALIGLLGFPPLVRELQHLTTDFQEVVQRLSRGILGAQRISLFGRSVDADEAAAAVVAAVDDIVGRPERMALAAGVAFGTIFSGFLVVVLLFYFLVSGPAIGAGLFKLAPPKQRPLLRRIWATLDPVLKRYFIGLLIVFIYAAVAAYVGLGFFLGIPHAVLLALMTGLLEMIPMVGPGLAAVVAGLVAVHYANGAGPIIAYAIYAAALRLSIDQFLGPLALGGAARLHPVMVIFCFLVGGVLFGVIGVILAVPAALATRTTLLILYDEPVGLTDS